MADWTPTELEKKLSNIKLAVTIPVNLHIEGTQRILDLSQMEQILSQTKHIAISDCACRKKNQKCNAPLEVCFSLDERAEKMAEKGSARKVSLAEALDALRRSHEAGLVHLTITYQGKEKPEVVCSCCSCCCHSLSGLIRFGMPDAVVTSKYIAAIDLQKCVDCGKCISRCQFKARWIESGQVRYDVKRCFGCGVCVSTCPTDAISLVERKSQ